MIYFHTCQIWLEVNQTIHTLKESGLQGRSLNFRSRCGRLQRSSFLRSWSSLPKRSLVLSFGHLIKLEAGLISREEHNENSLNSAHRSVCSVDVKHMMEGTGLVVVCLCLGNFWYILHGAVECSL